jgi:cytochrome c553
MTKLLPKKLINSAVLVVLALVLKLSVSCTDKKNGTVADGKIIYMEKCANCHSFKSSIDSESSLLQLSGLDSLQLTNKLNKARSDSTHDTYFSKLSDQDLNSIFLYIKDVQLPHQ